MVAPETVQESVLDVPMVIVPELAAKEEIVGSAPTVTVAVAVEEPLPLVAVSVYVVVLVGDTEVLVPVTVPTPLSIDKLVAPTTDQASVLEAPEEIEDGEAVNDAMVGLVPVTVTVVVAVAEPVAFVAVSV